MSSSMLSFFFFFWRGFNAEIFTIVSSLCFLVTEDVGFNNPNLVVLLLILFEDYSIDDFAFYGICLFSEVYALESLIIVYDQIFHVPLLSSVSFLLHENEWHLP